MSFLPFLRDRLVDHTEFLLPDDFSSSPRKKAAVHITL